MQKANGVGLFSRIEGYFKNDVRGRYVAVLLRELLLEDPNAAKALFGAKVGKSFVPSLEWAFPGSQSHRRADLALLPYAGAAVPSALIEIKCDDYCNPSNPAQRRDYISYAKKNGCELVYLSQYQLPANYDCVLFTELAERLDQRSAIARLFVQYLREKGLVVQEISADALRRLMVRFFMKHQSGYGKVTKAAMMTSGIPGVMQALLSNVRIVGAEVATHLGVDREPPADFYLAPEIKLTKKSLAKVQEAVSEADTLLVADSMRAGGTLYAFSRISINERNWKRYQQLEFGFEIEIHPLEKSSEGAKAPVANLYASVWCGNQNEYRSRRCKISDLGRREFCADRLTALARGVCKGALGNSDWGSDKKKLLRKLKLSSI